MNSAIFPMTFLIFGETLVPLVMAVDRGIGTHDSVMDCCLSKTARSIALPYIDWRYYDFTLLCGRQ